MFLLDNVLVYSARDLAAAASCEFAVLCELDAVLGLAQQAPAADDPMLERTARLGSRHEQRILADFRAEHGSGVVEIPRPEYTTGGLAEAAHATLSAVRDGAPVVYQGAFFDGRLVGFCDFLVREGDAYAVYDTKLSRHAKVEALLQLAAYADALEGSGVPVATHTRLILGQGIVSSHSYADIAPVYKRRRAHLETLVDEHRRVGAPARWEAGHHTACGRCDTCRSHLRTHRDLLLVAGMRATQRARLRTGGVSTIDDLAARSEPVEGLSHRAFGSLRAQARAQLTQERTGTPFAEVFDAAPLGSLPAPDDGDIFFDFEGDPLWCEDGNPDWGLEYLFGVVEGRAGTLAFRPFWAHNRSDERRALLDFLEYVAERRRKHPRMHVYHYAAYEKSALLRLAGRHGAGEDAVDQLLRDGVLVDLYPLVRGSIRIGASSYSIKKLEPLYMDGRGGDVVDAGASIVAYADYCDLRDAGLSDRAQQMLDSIAAYNEADCVSTVKLRNWLLDRAREHGIAPTGAVHDEARPEAEPRPEETRLFAYAGDATTGNRTHDQQAAALMAASLGYHRRERKPFWWAHFDRLAAPADEWADTGDTLIASSVTLDADWHKATPRQRKLRRRVRLVGDFDTGSTLRPKDKVFLLYESPGPEGLPSGGAGTRSWSSAEVVERTVDPHFHDVLVVEELLQGDEHSSLPMAVTPGSPIPSTSLEAAIESAASAMCDQLPTLPRTAAVDVLRRIPPRTRSGAGLPEVEDADFAAAITAAVLDLDESYLAVQGPPGTGKTYTGSRVVAALVREHGWRIGVVAQSHSVVENMLDGIVAAGVPGDRVVKAKTKTADPAWTAVPDARSVASYLNASEGGCVVGGTAWDFTNPQCIEPGSLDLLVVDEAGQFCLANTVAVARAAQNLLLLGDPQQLPQVSQGTHPEAVDESALGWLAEGHGALPAERGYFLSLTWRMHPDLCARVSDLSYDGRLLSKTEVTSARALDGVLPGVHTVRVDHRGNATCSEEESTEIVRQVDKLLGAAWTGDPDMPARPLDEADILVVAPYNAQVASIRTALSAAGLERVPVGTVDKFQGRQAAVVLVSMTASALEDVPRGMSFLLSRNRLNVALSRGQWCAIVVQSGVLTDYLPTTPDALAELGAFLRLTGGCDDPATSPRPEARR
ncbi:TM0106 family RecB-like putative nuclease [Rhodococcus sp. (in: high G+C Gram-positive bacteria)]|uniref:TM0106 family RecB-like putative nuclease n=1 Tax=Rhodococcus sp. TaxID=1831 RepID=UPI003F07CB9C